MKTHQIIIGWCVALTASCSPKTDNNDKPVIEKKADKQEFALNNEFNVEIRPDTTLSWYPIDGFKYAWQIFNDTAIVQELTTQFVLKVSSHYRTLWPCNLPNLFKNGDTIVITGNIFDVSKRENILGYPIVITKIYSHTSYRMGANKK